ncbi:MAG: hypothetical protein PVF83_16605 [Anaerolineales bacterium]|jgi:hypothetical protein
MFLREGDVPGWSKERGIVMKIFLGRYQLSILAFFAVIGWILFRHFVLEEDLLLSVGFVISVVFTELWKFIQIPIVITCIAIILLVMLSREVIPLVFASIEELRAGKVSAKLNTELFRKLVSEKIDLTKTDELPKELLEKSIDGLEVIANNMDYKLVRFLLDVDGLEMGFDDIVDKLNEKKIIDEESKTERKEEGLIEKTYYSAYNLGHGHGFFTGIYEILNSTAFVILHGEKENSVKLKLYPEFEELLVKRKREGA